jgi:circadian clock protein KaiC
LDVYTGPEGVLTGSARISLEAKEKAKALLREQEIERKRNQLEIKRLEMEASIQVMKARFESEKTELERSIEQEKAAMEKLMADRSQMARVRKAD